MTPEQIRSELALGGKKVTITSIAEKLGCSVTAVHLVIDKKSISQRIMIAVAETIHRPVEYVFPEYFRKAS